MKLSQYAKKVGISYKTAWRWYKAGTLDAYQTPTGMVVVRDPIAEKVGTGRIALYARVPPSIKKAIWNARCNVCATMPQRVATRSPKK